MSANHTDVEYRITVIDEKGDIIEFNKLCSTINFLLDFIMQDEENIKSTGKSHSYSITAHPYGGLR